MLKEFEITLELLKSKKNNLIQIIKDNKNDIIKNNQCFACYLNSIIQILFYFNEFRESILLCEVDDTDNNVLNELVIFLMV